MKSGRDAVRFMMLFRKNDAVLDFDLAKVIEQSRDNPVFYVQYGHARGQSVFRNARAAFPDLPADIASLVETADLERLSDPAELALMRQIALYPRVVEAAAAAHEPHRIAFYLFDLASEFHALYTLGNTSPHLRFIIQNDRQLTDGAACACTRRRHRARVGACAARGRGARRDAVMPASNASGARRAQIADELADWYRVTPQSGRTRMADNNFRSYRSRDPPLARVDARAGCDDPLAELARLIGQSDPAGDVGRDARRDTVPIRRLSDGDADGAAAAHDDAIDRYAGRRA